MISDRAFVFHMCIPCITYSLVPRSSVKIKIKYQVLMVNYTLSYFTYIFIVVRPFLCCQGHLSSLRSNIKVTLKKETAKKKKASTGYILFHRYILFGLHLTLFYKVLFNFILFSPVLFHPQLYR